MAENFDIVARQELQTLCKKLADFGAEILQDPPPEGAGPIRRAREDLLVAFANNEGESAEVYTIPIRRFCNEYLKKDERWTIDGVKRVKELMDYYDLGEMLKEIGGEVTGTPTLRTADEYEGKPMRFVWYPYIPCGEYTVMGATGGSGKGMASCLIAAYLTRGLPLPEYRACPDSLRAFSYREPQNVLFISAEDTGNELRSRLGVSNADLRKIFVLDKDNTTRLDFSSESGLESLRGYIEQSKARLVVIDPVQAFIGGETDMNRAAKMRTILSGFSHVAGEMECAILLIAHTNKRPQETDLNSGILGSVETVNASRSVLQILRDPEDEDPRTAARLILHTKSNNAALGQSVRFEIQERKRTIDGVDVIEAGGQFSESLYSDVTKEIFEEAVRRRVKPCEYLRMKKHEETELDELMEELRERANKLREDGKHAGLYSYDDFRSYVWGKYRPADAIKRVAYKLIGEGIAVRAKEKVTVNGKQSRGVSLTLTK